MQQKLPTKHRGKRRSAAAMAALLASTAMGLAPAAHSQPRPYAPDDSVREVVADPSGYGGQLALSIGGSRILRFSQPIGRVMVGDPKVGDVIPLSDRTLYVLGKGSGSTNLTVMPRSGVRPLATMDLRVGYDVDGLKRALHDIMPGEPVEVSARGDGLVISGVLSSSAAAARAAALAERYAPQKVVNLAAVRGAEQVMLSVRVSEVQRSVLKQLGVDNINALYDSTNSFGIEPGTFDPQALLSLGVVSKIGENLTIHALFNALERRGMATTLAEPNLVALSGETAVFFAGGEFPVPVPQSNGFGINEITIDYKQYGVSVAFTPTVFGDTINLLVAPEVSALDKENTVELQGFKIPGITTRRAKTTVELRPGQSFAIAGLIRKEFTDSIRGLPGASSLPLFGSLFRSTGFQNSETEVVIIVTAHLAKPTSRTNLLTPTDLQQAPTEAQLWLSNTQHVPRPATPAPAAPPATQP
jgi:pilus assembly protein CpaC